MERNAVPALKKNIALLDENIGMFCDDTRDAVKGSALKIRRPGFINGAKGMEADILRGVRAWCLDSGEYGEDHAAVKAPSQIITYVSSHDNQTLWDKLTETLPQADDAEKMRLNRMAAALYMTCQGTLFFLSGEEFARTKNGMEDSFNAPIALNRLDWTKAWENHELVEYYRGLIGLRSRLPGSVTNPQGPERISGMKRSEGLVSFILDNRSADGSERWDCVKIIYNSSRAVRTASAGDGDWEILCTGEDSSLWKGHHPAEKGLMIAPQSVLILGRIKRT